MRRCELIAAALAVLLGSTHRCPAAGVMARIPAGDYRPAFVGLKTDAVLRVPAFDLDQDPVTNDEFLAFVRRHAEWRRSRAPRLFAAEGYLASWASDLELGERVGASAPVVEISWYAAQAYARSAGKRLPTNAEWELAVRAGYATPDGAREADYRRAVLAWYARPADAVLPDVSVARRNYFGVRGLIGLTWEWTQDFNAVAVNEDSREASGVNEDLFCGAAGASARNFTDYPAFMRAAFRSALRADFALPTLGFRCARPR